MAKLVVIRQNGATGSMQENEFHGLMLSKMINSIIKLDNDALLISNCRLICYRIHCRFSSRNPSVIRRILGLADANKKAPVKPALFFDH